MASENDKNKDPALGSPSQSPSMASITNEKPTPALTPSADEIKRINEYLVAFGLSKRTVNSFDFALLDDDDPMPIRPSEVRHQTTKVLNSWVLRCLERYRDLDHVCQTLLYDFKEDFEGWSQRDFQRLNRDVRKKLRLFLNRQGIQVPDQQQTVILEHLTTASEPPQWDPALDIERIRSANKDSKAWAVIDTMTEERALNVPGSTQPTNMQPQDFQQAAVSQMTQHYLTPAQVPTPTIHQQQQIPQQWTTREPSRPPQAPQQLQGLPSLPMPTHPSFGPGYHAPPISNVFFRLPPLDVPGNRRDIDKITKFNKVWDKNDSFSGNDYEVLDTTLRVLLDLAWSMKAELGDLCYLLPYVLAGRAKDYHRHNIDPGASFATAYARLTSTFATPTTLARYATEFANMSYLSVRAQYNDKTPIEALDALFDRLQKCQRALGPSYGDETVLVTAVRRACRGVQELAMALALPLPTNTFAELSNTLRMSLQSHLDLRPSTFLLAPGHSHDGDHLCGEATSPRDDPFDTFYADRKFRRSGDRVNGNQGDRRDRGGFLTSRVRSRGKCYVCAKDDCRSWKHSEDERKRAKDRWVRKRGDTRRSTTFAAFLAQIEGLVSSDDEDNEDGEKPDLAQDGDGAATATYLCEEAFIHRVDVAAEALRMYDEPRVRDEKRPPTTFVLNRYAETVYQGILPDTGAAQVSTAGRGQFLALKRILDDHLELDESRRGEANINFGDGPEITSIGTAQVKTPFGPVTFHVLDRPTPFLMCLGTMDELGIYLNNVTNELVRENDGKRAPVTRRWGHPWLMNTNDNTTFLTEAELRRVHSRFGHPSVNKLHKMLTNAGHDAEREAIALVNKFCHHCQVKSQAPRRFKFSLYKDVDFNYEVLVDVLYLSHDGRKYTVLHVVDAATSFQAARILENISAKTTWLALRACWIDVYLGPPDIVSHDAGTNFAAAEFRADAKLMGITCNQVPIEAHWSIGKAERYHAPVRRAWDILNTETKGTLPPEVALQMAVKAVNDTAGPDGLVPTLLVFGAYPRVNSDSPPTQSQTQRAQAMAKAMASVKQLQTQRCVQDALNTRNGPDTTLQLPLSLPIGSRVLVWREKGDENRPGWTGPFKTLSVTDTAVTVDGDNGPTTFRTTHVKPYHQWNEAATSTQSAPNDGDTAETWKEAPSPFEYPTRREARKRGRPRKNDATTQNSRSLRPNTTSVSSALVADLRRPAGEPCDGPTESRQQPMSSWMPTAYPNLALRPPLMPLCTSTMLCNYMTQKERADFDEAVMLRREGKITTPGRPFEEADMKEIDGLFAAGVIQPVRCDATFEGMRIFDARLVRSIKGKTMGAPYEKSRLVVRGFNDHEKDNLMTTAPTIQRCSQRLMLAIMPTLRQMGMKVMLRDITMAYTQSQTQLNRTVITRLPAEIRDKYPEGTVLRIIKPLYGLAEAGNHWFDTYHKHHLEQLGMETSTYDPCLLVTKINEDFGVTGLQTDDTVNVGTDSFLAREQAALEKAGFKAKPAKILEDGDTGEFNGCLLHLSSYAVEVRQKGQTDKIQPIGNGDNAPQQYVEQRARAAYIASICQPEATFDCSVAAQHREPDIKAIKALNERLVWQKANPERGLRFVTLNLATVKVFVFVDGSFAGNADLSSQIGYIVILGNESPASLADSGVGDTDGTWRLRGNLIHWSSTKCKRITRSVLASEIYGMSSGLDLGYVLAGTLNKISLRLGLPRAPIVLCTDSYSLYQCLVQLGNTTEKRLMIDVMAIRESYERREVDEIRWIKGEDNVADAMTKAKPNGALTRLISRNEITVRMEAWVQREEQERLQQVRSAACNSDKRDKR